MLKTTRLIVVLGAEHPFPKTTRTEDDMATHTPEAREITTHSMFIDGNWVQGNSGRTFESADPYRLEPWARVPEADTSDVDAAVSAAHGALEGPWGQMSGAERAAQMRRLADVLERRGSELAEVEVRDNGKLLREMSAHLAAAPGWFHFFAGAADKQGGHVIDSAKKNFFVYTLRQPVGVVGLITAWNSPILILCFKLAPALAAGCTVVVKPAEQAPVSTLGFARLIEESGFPPGVFNVVTGGPDVGRALVEHPRVDKVALTGSTATGIKVAQGAASHLARASLELGGNAPNIVFEDADLDAALNGVVSAIFAAAGQSCVAGARLLVHDSVHDALLERVIERARSIRLGDPMLPETEMGPLAFEEHHRNVMDYIELARQEGATVLIGGGPPADLPDGLFLAPTVLTDVHEDMRVVREEIFGPVLTIMRFANEEQAISLANDTPYGLAAGLWTNDLRRAHRVARALQAGTIWVNDFRVENFDVPFGGMKLSGIGRENGLEAIREYQETKAVWIELSGALRDPFQLG